MAQAAEPHHRPSDAPSTERERAPLVRRRLRGGVRAATFWAAVVLPFLYLPLLAAGLRTRADLVVFLALLGCNLLAIHLGRGHRPIGVAVHR